MRPKCPTDAVMKADQPEVPPKQLQPRKARHVLSGKLDFQISIDSLPDFVVS
jgi:hypothetical protein